MKTAIVYYSATGNTLYVAKKFPHEGLFNILDLLSGKVKLPESIERLGIFSPVYYGGLPYFVSDFITKILKERDNSDLFYIFSVLTKGAKMRICERIMEKDLEEIGLNLSFSDSIVFPDCFLPIMKKSPTEEETALIKERADSKIREIIELTNRESIKLPPFSLIYNLVRKFSLRKDSRGHKNSFLSVSSSCSRCSLCASICPNNNITIENKAIIGDRCIECYACYNFCCEGAIEYRGKSESRYTPLVSIKELERK